jgi:hypothetical protein
LDFAQLIAQRRASRVAQNTQIQADTNHFWNLKNSIELENAFQEKERMAVHLRLGRVPAHISYPIFAALHPQARRPMEVDEAVETMEVDPDEVMIDGIVQKIAQRSARTKELATSTRKTARKAGVLHMGEFTPEETAVGRGGAAGIEARKQFPGAVVTRNVKRRARNRATKKAFEFTDAKRAA